MFRQQHFDNRKYVLLAWAQGKQPITRKCLENLNGSLFMFYRWFFIQLPCSIVKYLHSPHKNKIAEKITNHFLFLVSSFVFFLLVFYFCSVLVSGYYILLLHFIDANMRFAYLFIYFFFSLNCNSVLYIYSCSLFIWRVAEWKDLKIWLDWGRAKKKKKTKCYDEE